MHQSLGPYGDINNREVFGTCLGMGDAETERAYHLIRTEHYDIKFDNLDCLKMLRSHVILK